jgi:hypothetical protein
VASSEIRFSKTFFLLFFFFPHSSFLIPHSSSFSPCSFVFLGDEQQQIIIMDLERMPLDDTLEEPVIVTVVRFSSLSLSLPLPLPFLIPSSPHPLNSILRTVSVHSGKTFGMLA